MIAQLKFNLFQKDILMKSQLICTEIFCAAFKHPNIQAGRVSLLQLQPVPLLQTEVMEEKEEEELHPEQIGRRQRQEVPGAQR